MQLTFSKCDKKTTKRFTLLSSTEHFNDVAVALAANSSTVV